MKKSEKEKLKQAFNIPEPERKEFFVSLYNEKLKKNERKFNMPVFFGYASTVAFASLIIGLWGHFNETADFNNKFNNTEITSTTTTTTVQTVTTAQSTEKTSSASTEPPTTELTSATSYTAEAIQPTTHALIEIPDFSEFIPPETVTTLSTATQSATTSKITFTTKTASYPTTTKRTTTTVLTVIEPVPDFTEPPFATTTEIPAVHATTTYYTAIPTMIPAITTTSRGVDCPSVVTTTIDYSPTPSVPSLASHDYIVYPDDVYSKSDKTVDIRDFIENNASSDFNTTSDIQKMIDNSDYIVSGRVDQIIYTQINGRPYTQENITIYAVYKGKMLKSNDRISIYIQGGYIPVSEFEKLHNLSIDVPDDYSVYDSGGNKGIQNIGDTFMFFIKNGSYNMPQKAFQLTEYTDISVFRKNNDKYISLGNENLYFDIKKLLNL
ncbi:MAG: hypothetical protein K2N27_06930 [Ruminococcus sp.]|nr:hypothetical protein [Ruminococcus sp.]